MREAAVIIIGYLLGSIPFGYLIVKAKEGGDIRQTGSGGTGATNVSRRAGKFAGVLTLLLDAFKGAAAVVIAGWWLGSTRGEDIYWLVAAAGVFAIVGHMFPVWLRFRGGKGVATGVGVFLVLAPIAVAMTCVIFLLIVWSTRYVSLGSIVSAAALPVAVLIQNLIVRPRLEVTPVMTAAIVCAALIIFAHRENIFRLKQGTENKFR